MNKLSNLKIELYHLLDKKSEKEDLSPVDEEILFQLQNDEEIAGEIANDVGDDH